MLQKEKWPFLIKTRQTDLFNASISFMTSDASHFRIDLELYFYFFHFFSVYILLQCTKSTSGRRISSSPLPTLIFYSFSRVTISITISHKAYEQWVFRDKNLSRKAASQGGKGLEQNCPWVTSDMLSSYIFHRYLQLLLLLYLKTVRKTCNIFLYYRYRPFSLFKGAAKLV